MPIYEYECRGCESEFEFFHRSSSDTASCPDCKGTDLQKRFSTFGVGSSSGPSARAASLPT